MMEYSHFENHVGELDNFNLRKSMERLRDGLFDPIAVRFLTVRNEQLSTRVEGDLDAVASGRDAHLCICGAYGRGKTHSLSYVRDLALRRNFVVSSVNLDPRERPLQNIPVLFRTLMCSLRFPGKLSDRSFGEVWEEWASSVVGTHDAYDSAQERALALKKLFPARLPHLFRCVMTAIAQQNMNLSPRERRLKKHRKFRPHEFTWLLDRALRGEPLSSIRLYAPFRYRGVRFYRENSLTLKKMESYLDLVEALALLFRQMGFHGWVLLFDEGESVAQTRLLARSKAYRVIDRLCGTDGPTTGLYPVFAFTDDFFERLSGEDFDRQRKWKNRDLTNVFRRDYDKVFRNLRRYDLEDFSPAEWRELVRKITFLHTMAYRWEPQNGKIHETLTEDLQASQTRETRLKLKRLVEMLDCFEHGLSTAGVENR